MGYNFLNNFPLVGHSTK